LEDICIEAFDCVKVLIKYGADVNQQQPETVYKAIKKNNIDLLNILLDNGAQVNPGLSSQRLTPLMTTAYHGYTDMLRILLARSAVINIRHYNQTSAPGMLEQTKIKRPQ